MMTPEEQAKKLSDSYRIVFTSPDGVVCLTDLFKRANVGNSSFAADPCQTAYNNGWRDAVLYILERVDYEESKRLDRFRRLLRSRTEE